jgi:hypothetical protein
LKLIQERIGEILEHIGIGNDFLNKILIAQQLREKTGGKWDCINPKSFCTAKSLHLREKIFASCSSDKGLITRLYRELKKLYSQRISNPMKK